jgi:RNAse (barnase) inhibitor barstar
VRTADEGGDVEAGFPRYRLIDDTTGAVLVEAEEVGGFFVAPEDEPDEVTFSGLHLLDDRKRATEDAVLEMLNRRGEKIGEYFIGRADRGRMSAGAGAGAAGAKPTAVHYRSVTNRCEFPEAEAIWRRWASGAVVERDEWLAWPSDHHDAWLHVVQNSWFTSGRRAARYGTDSVARLNGAHISKRASFYCALGEAVNGPGGYFGSNLDALADCLSADSGDAPPLRIAWVNIHAAQESVGPEFVDSAVAVLQEFDVEVTTH